MKTVKKKTEKALDKHIIGLYHNDLKEHPDLNERPLRMSTPLHS